MADRPAPGASADTISAELIAHRGFTVTRRGFDQDQVREFLQLVAGAVRGLHERIERLESAVADAEHRAANPQLDEDTLLRLVGEETGAILRSARAAAVEISAAAARESTALREAAAREVAELRETAARESTELREAAAREVAELRETAARESTALREEVAELREAAARESTALREAVAQEVVELRAAVEQEVATLRESARAESSELRESAEAQSRELRESSARESTALRESAASESAELRARADSEAARVVDEARQMAGDLHSEAESALARATEQAEAAVARLRASAQESATQVVERARNEAEVLRQQAEHERRLTVEGAQAVRDRILGDLTRRRRVASTQIEQLRAGRERLLQSYAVVRRTLEEVNDELHRADAEAREAAAAAGRAQDELPDEDLIAPDLIAPPGLAPTGEPGEVAAGTAAPGPSPRGEGAGPDGPPPAVATAPVEGGEVEAGAVEAGALGAGQVEGGQVEAGQVEAGDASVPVGAVTVGAVGEGDAAAPADLGAITVEARDERVGEPLDAVAGVEVLAAAGAVSVESAPRRAGSRAGRRPAASAAPDGVDDLFARLRAGRLDAVTRAHEVLDPGSGEGAEPGPPVASASTSAAGATDDREASAGVGSDRGAAEVAPSRGASDRDLEPTRSDEEEAWLQRRDEALGQTEQALTRKLKRALQDEQNDLLDHLRSLRGRPTADNLLRPVAEQTGRFSSAATVLVEQGAQRGSEFALGLLEELGREVGPPGTPAAVDDVTAELASAIVTPLRRRLEQTILESGDEEQSVVVEALGGAYREWKTQRIERIAGDALAAAFARGVAHATPGSGALRWVVDDIDGPCSDCDDNVLAGPLAPGEAFPTGQVHPPAHTGCRCIVVPGL